MSPWEILGVPPAADRATIRRAYAARLKQCRPDDDREGFQRLREAYEMMLSGSAHVSEPVNVSTPSAHDPPATRAAPVGSEAMIGVQSAVPVSPDPSGGEAMRWLSGIARQGMAAARALQKHPTGHPPPPRPSNRGDAHPFEIIAQAGRQGVLDALSRRDARSAADLLGDAISRDLLALRDQIDLSDRVAELLLRDDSIEAERLLEIVERLGWHDQAVLPRRDRRSPQQRLRDRIEETLGLTPLIRRAQAGEATAQLDLGEELRGRGEDSEAAAWFRRAAQQGLAEAQYRVGVLTRDGHGVAQDFGEAVKWLRAAADQGHASSITELGRLLWFGSRVPKDPNEAVQLFERAAAQGDLTAQFHLGVIYSNGEYVPADPERAFRWYMTAAQRGHAGAQTNCAQMLTRGVGGPADFPAAFRWYMRAAKQGNASGMNGVGLCYREGAGVEQDFAKAAMWLTRAAELGQPNAMHTLATMSAGGQGMPRDLERAYHWLARAILGYRSQPEKLADALSGYGRLCDHLAPAQRHRLDSGLPDSTHHRRLYEMAAQHGVGATWHTLAILYATGVGGPVDHVAAFRWFLAAAERGDDNAMNSVGHALLEGRGVERDLAKAAGWLGRAAAAGQPGAMHSLAVLYLNGTGVPRSLEDAYRWAALALRAYPPDADKRQGLERGFHQLSAALAPDQRQRLDSEIARWQRTAPR
jgi:TPR repeat protein